MASTKTYYETLGVSRDATTDEIKKAYRKLARKYHPDAGGDEDTFKEINIAYETLSDPDKRKQYDQFGQYASQAGAGGYRGGYPGGGTYTYTTTGGQVNLEDILKGFGGFGGFADMFGGAAAAGAAGAAGAGPRTAGGGCGGGCGGHGASSKTSKGRDIKTTLNVTFDEAFSGTTKKVKLRNPDSGDIEEITVKVPAGAVDGGKLRYKGKGGYGPSGQRGDLLIVTKIEPHPVFSRKNADVCMNLNVWAWEAALGTKVTIPTPSGEKIKLNVPAGTQSGKTFVLSGKGAPKVKGEGSGDFKVTVEISVPQKLTNEQRQALEALKQADEQVGTSARPEVDELLKGQGARLTKHMPSEENKAHKNVPYKK